MSDCEHDLIPDSFLVGDAVTNHWTQWKYQRCTKCQYRADFTYHNPPACGIVDFYPESWHVPVDAVEGDRGVVGQ